MTRRIGGRARRSDRLAAGIRQAAEYAIAVALIGFSLHANGGALLLLGAAVTVALWAAINDAPLAGMRIVGPGLHRAGVLVEAVVLAGLPFVTARLADLSLSGPALFAAIMLFQLAVTRRSGDRRPHSDTGPSLAVGSPTGAHDGRRPPSPTGIRSEPGPRSTVPSQSKARVAGQVSARVATVVTKQAAVTLPAGARRVGRMAGRLNARRRR